MTESQRNDIAGAIFDFAGFLTAHKEVIAVGATAWASPMVWRIQEWAEARGLSLEAPNVMAWNDALAEPAPEPVAVPEHWSDCSTNNEPAYPAGNCDCTPTPAMCRAAVEVMNGPDVYGKVPREALDIEEGIYRSVWLAMQSAAPVREPAPVLEKKGLFVDLIAQHPGLAEELAAMDVPAPVQEPEHYTVDAVAWEGFLHDYGKYVDGHVKYPFSAVRESLAAVIDSAEAAQPRKAVKLSDSEILAALEVEYVSSAQNRHLFLSDARTIEAAVWAKLGVEP